MQTRKFYIMRNRLHLTLPLFIVTVILAACAPAEPAATPTPRVLGGGVLATFEVINERFNVFITNEETIQQILDLQTGVGTETIPNGPVRRGPGEAQHNEPYTWHLDPEETVLTEFSDPICDGPPTYIEEHLEDFDGQLYCPGNSRLVEVLDLR
jgi:hypothetical protein